MQDKSDAELLCAFAGQRDEAAFREIVTRYADLVYSAAFRQVGSGAAASDIAQGVFTDLARKAGTLAAERASLPPSLAGWLHRATRYAALNHLRDARRRLTKERQAMEQLLTNSESTGDWEEICPALDEALDSLGDEEREALLLRYFKNLDFRAVGLALGVSNDTAQKRVSRAVERLREFFSKRNVTIGASGLAVLISANAVQSAPVGLALSISAAALAGTALTTPTAITITKAIAMTTLQKTLVAATIAVLAVGGIYEAHRSAQFQEENQRFRQQEAALGDQIEQLQRKRDAARKQAATLPVENSPAQPVEKLAELLKLRGQVGALRNQLAAQAGSPAKAIASLMDDPAQKELSRMELMKALKSRYDSFINTHNLSPDTADKLYGLITQNELAKKDRLAGLVRGDLDVASALQDRDQARQEAMQQVRSLLGEETYNQFMDFNHQFEASTRVATINGQMGANLLDDQQSKRLQDLLAAQPDVTVDEVDLFRSKESLDSVYQEQFNRAQNLLQQASGFLNPEQTAALGVINSNSWSDIRAKMTLNQQLINSTLGRHN